MATAAERKRREERVKLAAQAVANIGTAFAIGGFVGPVLLGKANGVAASASLGVAIGFHVAAQFILRYVAEEPKEDAP